MQKEQVIHERTVHAPVTVSKRMNVFEHRMEVGGNREGIAPAHRFKFFKQTGDFRLDFMGASADVSRADHVIPDLVGAKTLSHLPTTLIVCSLRKCLMHLEEHGLIKGLPPTE